MYNNPLLMRFTGSPICMEPAYRIEFENMLRMKLSDTQNARINKRVEKCESSDAWSENNRYAQLVLENTPQAAILKINGIIDRNLDLYDIFKYGMFDLNDLNNAIDAIQSDDSIRNVLLQIDSPGGTVSGVPEAAERIVRLAESKNVFAFIDGLGCSAAYWIASGADQIFSTASSNVGSIGVYSALLDVSRALDRFGVTVETIKAGKLKAAGAPWKPLTEEERAHFQSNMDSIYSYFKSTVTAKRALEDSTMQGQSFFGRTAVSVGLVDAILPDRSAALAQF